MSEEKKGFGGFEDMVSHISSDITRDTVGMVDSGKSESSSAGRKAEATAPSQAPSMTLPSASPKVRNLQKQIHR